MGRDEWGCELVREWAAQKEPEACLFQKRAAWFVTPKGQNLCFKIQKSSPSNTWLSEVVVVLGCSEGTTLL